MVTLKDIANKTGFSLSVVSRAMNPSPDQKVAEKTREIILATAAELGYRPNHAASLLAKGMSTAIGCFMPAMVGEMVGQIVSGLSYAANQAGFAYQLYFGNSLEDYRHFIDHCQHTSAAGMISYLPANVDPCNKNDEFYTQYEDIQREVNAYLEYNPDVFKGKTVLLPCDDPEWSNFTRFFAQNFESLGIKKLISTSYATESKQKTQSVQLTIFDFLTDYETKSPQYDKTISHKRGKIFTLTRDMNKSGTVDIDDLEWHYLKGDGDFRSEEVTKLRDEADIIVTNPPFSLFRELSPA